MKRHAPASIKMDLLMSPSPVFILKYICKAPMMATIAAMAYERYTTYNIIVNV